MQEPNVGLLATSPNRCRHRVIFSARTSAAHLIAIRAYAPEQTVHFQAPIFVAAISSAHSASLFVQPKIGG